MIQSQILYTSLARRLSFIGYDTTINSSYFVINNEKKNFRYTTNNPKEFERKALFLLRRYKREKELSIN